MSDRDMSFWGWGYADRFPDAEARRALGQQVRAMMGFDELQLLMPPRLDDIAVKAARVAVPDRLAAICTDDRESRIRHTYGRAYRDMQRGFQGDFSPAPDLVARPRDERDVADVLDWASAERVAVIPYGGGTSVVGGVEPAVEGDYRGALSLDMRSLNAVVEVDETSRSARIQAGATGPEIEAALAPRGLTLRHYPQSFEFSTLGGWVATRSGGHYATGYTHIDDFVASIRMLTPAGPVESWRLPGSGAGPSPDRWMIGSEGIFGVITEAWMRLQHRPRFRSNGSFRFADWGAAVEATRQLAQSGLWPTNCRLLDRWEARVNGVVADNTHVLLVGFESADHGCLAKMARARTIAEEAGGNCPEGVVHRDAGSERNKGAGSSWRQAFIDLPYMANVLISLGVIWDTFETACTWSNFEALHSALVSEVRSTMKRVCGRGVMTCRFTHVYPDGPAPYYTVIAPASPGRALDQWTEIKSAASDVLSSHGATITHHHAVGRVHRPWYDRQRPNLFAAALRAAKERVDPAAIMNPGVLIDPERAD